MFKGKLILVLLIVSLVLLASLPAMAVDPVDPSDTLEVCLKTASGTVTLHTYSKAEMEALASDDDVYYSGIDAMPWTVKTEVSEGVYFEDLLDDVQTKYMLGQYSTLDVWDFDYLRFVATDGASARFTYNDLFCDRYYFSALHDESGGLNEDGVVDYDYGDGELVQPMLAMVSKQGRLPMPSEYRDDYEPECYTILFGMTEEEVDNTTQRVSEYKRGVEKMTIDLGNASLPQVDVTGISLDKTSATVYTGKSIQLTSTISPSDATNTGVAWTSSDESVATVSATGVVTGIDPGTSTITATAAGDTTKSAICTVTVRDKSEYVSVTGVTISNSTLTLGVGSTKTLTANVLPSGAGDRDVSWTSSNEKIATVKGGLVTAVAAGQAQITVKTDDGGFTAVCTVTVTDKAIAATGVSLNKTTLRLTKNGSFQLVANIAPDGATNTNVVWSSSAPGVVTVATNGLLTAKNTGASTITVLTEDGSFSAQCLVTVAESAFSDTSGNWAGDYINNMVNAGFISGYTNGSFKPSASITRAEFISILIRILQSAKGEKLQTGNVFNDTSSHWAKDYISTAVALAITSGYGNGKFGSDDPITREQLAVMLAKAAGSSGSSTASSFKDASKISSWASSSVAYAAEKGWISGYSDGSFGPQKQASRAEVCAMLWRFYQQINQ